MSLVKCSLEQIIIDFEASLLAHKRLLEDNKLHKQLEELANSCLATLKSGGKIFFAGNGGSFADSQHLAAEFVSRLQFDREALAAIALGTNSSNMSAIGNDYGYDKVFSREIAALGRAEDIFIPISTSGNSRNIIAAVEVAKKMNLKVVGFSGKDGGKLAKLCSCIIMPAQRTERIQEGHILCGHILCASVETAYFKPSNS